MLMVGSNLSEKKCAGRRDGLFENLKCRGRKVMSRMVSMERFYWLLQEMAKKNRLR